MTIPASKLSRYLDTLTYPCPVYYAAHNGIAHLCDRVGLMRFITRGEVMGVGSWKHVKRIRLCSVERMSATREHAASEQQQTSLDELLSWRIPFVNRHRIAGLLHKPAPPPGLYLNPCMRGKYRCGVTETRGVGGR